MSFSPAAFDLANWPVVLLALVPALLNVAIFVYVLVRSKRNALTYSFALFVASLVVWQISESLMRMSRTAETAAFWGDVLAGGGLLIGPFGVHFALLFTERRDLARSPIVWLSLYGPAVMLELLSRAGLNEGLLLHQEPWGWMTTVPAPVLSGITGLWVATLAFTTLVLLFSYAWHLRGGGSKRRQALLVAGGFAVPTLQGTVTQVLFPTFLGLEPIPVASTFMTAFSISTFIALRRYEFLELPTIEEQLQSAQTEVHRRAQELAEAQRIAHIGNWVWDVPANSVQWSDEMYRIYGYDIQSFPVTFEKAMERVFPEDRARTEKSVAEDLRRGRAGQLPLNEYRIRLPDGRIRTLHGQGTLEVDASGGPTRMIGTVQDVTALKAAEEESRRAERAQRESEERRREVERLREINDFKNQFINAVAHELKTPMTPLQIQLYMLHQQRSGGKPLPEKDPITILERNLQRLGALVDDLLDAGRLQAARLGMRREEFDLVPRVRESVQTFAPQAKRDRVELHATLAAHAWVAADPDRLTQVFHNLLSNALKFTPAGGRVDVVVRVVSGDALLTVHDTGIGLTREQADLLFQPFVRLHEETQAEAGGTGLGLYISKGLVELMGGRIWCESGGPGQGTTFSVSLPANRVGPPTAARRGDHEGSTIKGPLPKTRSSSLRA